MRNLALRALASLLLAALPAAAAPLPSKPPVAISAKPNILLIIVDQQHAGMLGCAGNPLIRIT